MRDVAIVLGFGLLGWWILVRQMASEARRDRVLAELRAKVGASRTWEADR